MTQADRHDLAVRMAEMARAVASPRSLDDVLAGVTAAAMELIPGVDAAGVLLIGNEGTFQTLPAAGIDIAHKLHELQMGFDDGPCVKEALEDVVVRIDDFREETRWPAYAPACVEIGILSGMVFQLYTATRRAGTLNLFSFRTHVWTAEAETFGAVLAAHATAAILASQQEAQLETALSTRDRIGQAKGIIMERFDVDDLRAFDMLRQLSQDTNVKLVDIARRVIDTRAQ